MAQHMKQPQHMVDEAVLLAGLRKNAGMYIASDENGILGKSMFFRGFWCVINLRSR
jgi:hypothetical protein